MKKYYILFAAAVVICIIYAACANNTKAELICVTDVESSANNTTIRPETDIYDNSERSKDSSDEQSVEESTDCGSGIQDKICVYVCGAVNSPGVYEFDKGARAYEAVEAAGGFSYDAGEDYVNLAAELTDGQKLKIPTVEEMKTMAPAGDFEEAQAGEGAVSGTDSSRININTADAARLTQIPGVGQAKADAIVSYRNKNGNFRSVDEIMKVPGIKEASFEKMKDYICTDP